MKNKCPIRQASFLFVYIINTYTVDASTLTRNLVQYSTIGKKCRYKVDTSTVCDQILLQAKKTIPQVKFCPTP